MNENFWISNKIAHSLEINWQYVIIGSVDGLALNRQQYIIWSNDDLIFYALYMSLGLNELRL